jgi:hypothetical protein
MSVSIGGENIAHLVQSNNQCISRWIFIFLNWVQLSYDFGNVVPNGTTQGKVCHYWNPKEIEIEFFFKCLLIQLEISKCLNYKITLGKKCFEWKWISNVYSMQDL